MVRGRTIQSEGLKRDRVLQMQMWIPLMKIMTYGWGLCRCRCNVWSRKVPGLATERVRINGAAVTGVVSCHWRQDTRRRRHGVAAHASVLGGAWAGGCWNLMVPAGEGRRRAVVATMAVICFNFWRWKVGKGRQPRHCARVTQNNRRAKETETGKEQVTHDLG